MMPGLSHRTLLGNRTAPRPFERVPLELAVGWPGCVGAVPALVLLHGKKKRSIWKQDCTLFMPPKRRSKSEAFPTVGKVSAKAKGTPVKVEPPPADYNHRHAMYKQSRGYIYEHYPQLSDLVENGTVMVVQRPENYVERREDGYREPEVVFLVGTAHLSRHSAADVTRVMKAVKPENVVVELCRSRAAIMYTEDTDEEPEPSTSGNANLMSFSGQGSFNDAVGRSLELGGRPAMAMRLALGSIADRLSESMGVKTGVEWQAARVAAEELGSQIVLGDRPIEITLQRAWAALGFGEKWRFLWFVFYALTTPGFTMTEEVMDLFKDDDALSVAFKECAAKFPGLMGPLTHEREMYLAWSLKRSKAVNGTKRVVGVIGRGHMRGVVYYLTHSQDKLRFKDLVGERKKRGSNPVARLPPFVRNLIIELVAGTLLWWLWTGVLSKYDIPFHF